MDANQIESVISDLIYIRKKLYNGIFGGLATRALTNAISLLRELQAIRQGEGQQMEWMNDGRVADYKE